MATDTPSFLAVDLGAESGRAVLGTIENQRLKMEEIHRFPNSGVQLGGSLLWDITGLWREIKKGLALAAAGGSNLLSMGVDTWGVDYGLLDASDNLIGIPVHYRDPRTDGMMARAFQHVPREEIYNRTGIQFMQLNSLFQLFAMVEAKAPVLEIARTFLNMPDLINFWLTGQKVSEFSIATTTQCYDPRAGGWAVGMLEALGIPSRIFTTIVPPGTNLGGLRADVAAETGASGVRVVAPATHDTGSAVAAVPAENPDYIYLSSGTWSLMGIETRQPIITVESLEANITNEGGVNGTFRFLKNITGLWLVQECRREWGLADGRTISYDEITHWAEEAPAFQSLVLPGEGIFLAPGNMPQRIQDFCATTGQKVPRSRGEILRCVFESLALAYRVTAEHLDHFAGKRLPVIHIIGGGSKNNLLNQFTASATGRTVVTGPVEATAIGNILMQAVSLGVIGSLEEGRAMVRRSFDTRVYQPQDSSAWDEAYGRYQILDQKFRSMA